MPVIEKAAGRWRVMSRLFDREDDRRNVVVCVMGRLEAGGLARLRTFHELLGQRNGTAGQWLRVLVERAAIRYTEGHPDRLGSGTEEDPRRWAETEPLPEEPGEEALLASDGVIDAIEAHEILAYAERVLAPEQLAALRLRLSEHTDAEIAEELGLPDAHAARKLVRAAVSRLRYRFAGDDGPEPPSKRIDGSV